MSEDSQRSAVYVSWATFKNCIEQLAQGVPNVIDRTVFPGLSGGVQSQLFAGMRFLGLIDDKSRPLKDLHELAVTDESARIKKLGGILRKSYSELFALDLEKTTPGQALQTMRDAYDVSGDTADKAMRFFLSAAEYVQVPLSSLFKSSKAASGGNGGVTTARRKARKVAQKPASADPPKPAGDSGQGESRTVELRSGGTLTVSATTGWMALSTEDRNFVFDLIDKLTGYEQGKPK